MNDMGMECSLHMCCWDTTRLQKRLIVEFHLPCQVSEKMTFDITNKVEKNYFSTRTIYLPVSQ